MNNNIKIWTTWRKLFCIFLHMSPFLVCSKYLHYDWQGGVYTALAKQIAKYDQTCHKETYNHIFRNSGLGAEIHVYSQALCNSMQYNVSLNIVGGDKWIWNDRQFCYNASYTLPATPKDYMAHHQQQAKLNSNTEQQYENIPGNNLVCYFGHRNPCPHAPEAPHIPHGNKFNACPTFIRDYETRAVFRAAVSEYMFSNVSRRLVEEAEMVATYLFEEYHYPTFIPRDMITVHIRWGDKSLEMELVNAATYAKAVVEIILQYNITQPHVHLVAEQSDAGKELKEELVKLLSPMKRTFGFTTYGTTSVYSIEKLGLHSGGFYGKVSLINLLIAMEAKHYVITTGSNWSRLINELRTNVIDQRCGEPCTTMKDLRGGMTFHNW